MRNRTLVVGLLLVGLVVGLALNAAGSLQQVHDMVFSALAPLQYSVHWASLRLAETVQVVRNMRTLQDRVAELQRIVDQLTVENLELREADIERLQLREQLRFKLTNPSYDLIAAEVIGYDPSLLLHYITIDRGTADGVGVNMPVVTAQGLVGRVTVAFVHSSRVMLLADPSSSVNAILQTSRVTGIVRGRGRQNLVLDFVQSDLEIDVGEIILTSGLGGAFPKRLVIGQVTEVKRNDVDMFQEVRVRPAVDFDRLEMVMVIRGFTNLD